MNTLTTKPDPEKPVYVCPNGCGDSFDSIDGVVLHLQVYHHLYKCEARVLAQKARRVLPHEVRHA